MSYGMNNNTGRSGGSGRNLPEGYSEIDNWTPEMHDLYNRNMGNLGEDSFINKVAQGDEETFNQLEAPGKRQFTATQGNIASRFSGGGGGQGAMSSRRSSGHQNFQNAAASDFAEKMQSNRVSMQMQAIKDMSQMSNDLLRQEPYSTVEDAPSAWETFLGSLGQGLGKEVGGLPAKFAGKFW